MNENGNKIVTLQQLIAAHTKSNAKMNALVDRVEAMETAGGEPNVITQVRVNGTALEITDKAVDIGVSIAEAVAASDHLKRRIVTGVDAIDPTAEGADQYIYMVPKTGSDEDDVYDEYMVLGGKVEHVGNTKVDLSNYVQKEDGMGLSQENFTTEEKNKLAGIEFATDEEVAAALAEIYGDDEANSENEA